MTGSLSSFPLAGERMTLRDFPKALSEEKRFWATIECRSCGKSFDVNSAASRQCQDCYVDLLEFLVYVIDPNFDQYYEKNYSSPQWGWNDRLWPTLELLYFWTRDHAREILEL